jgi:hypothetical protein
VNFSVPFKLQTFLGFPAIVLDAGLDAAKNGVSLDILGIDTATGHRERFRLFDLGHFTHRAVAKSFRRPVLSLGLRFQFAQFGGSVRTILQNIVDLFANGLAPFNDASAFLSANLALIDNDRCGGRLAVSIAICWRCIK